MAQKLNYANVPYPQPVPEVITANNTMADLLSLKGKVASITGSSGGIGFEIAKAFAQQGADVAIWYNSRDPTDKASELAKNYGVKVKTYKAAIDNYDSVKATIDQQIKEFGKIDIFVANAGVSWGAEGSIIDQPNNDEWHKIQRVNVDGVYYCAKVVGPHFRERHSGSFIVTTSMSSSIVPVPFTLGAYATSKGAVLQLAKTLAIEWAGFARVNTVSPGYCRSDMVDAIHDEFMDQWAPLIPMARMSNPREIAGAYVFLASDASTYVTGSEIKVDGGYTTQ